MSVAVESVYSLLPSLMAALVAPTAGAHDLRVRARKTVEVR